MINGCIIEIIGKTIGIKLIRKAGWSGIAETIVIVQIGRASCRERVSVDV